MSSRLRSSDHRHGFHASFFVQATKSRSTALPLDGARTPPSALPLCHEELHAVRSRIAEYAQFLRKRRFGTGQRTGDRLLGSFLIFWWRSSCRWRCSGVGWSSSTPADRPAYQGHCQGRGIHRPGNRGLRTFVLLLFPTISNAPDYILRRPSAGLHPQAFPNGLRVCDVCRRYSAA